MATEIPFVGPSYDLKVKKSDVQRAINLMPTPIESGTGKAAMFLKPVPGLVMFSGQGGDGVAQPSVCFVVDNFVPEGSLSGYVGDSGVTYSPNGRGLANGQTAAPLASWVVSNGVLKLPLEERENTVVWGLLLSDYEVSTQDVSYKFRILANPNTYSRPFIELRQYFNAGNSEYLIIGIGANSFSFLGGYVPKVQFTYDYEVGGLYASGSFTADVDPSTSFVDVDVIFTNARSTVTFQVNGVIALVINGFEDVGTSAAMAPVPLPEAVAIVFNQLSDFEFVVDDNYARLELSRLQVCYEDATGEAGTGGGTGGTGGGTGGTTTSVRYRRLSYSYFHDVSPSIASLTCEGDGFIHSDTRPTYATFTLYRINEYWSPITPSPLDYGITTAVFTGSQTGLTDTVTLSSTPIGVIPDGVYVAGTTTPIWYTGEGGVCIGGFRQPGSASSDQLAYNENPTLYFYSQFPGSCPVQNEFFHCYYKTITVRNSSGVITSDTLEFITKAEYDANS